LSLSPLVRSTNYLTADCKYFIDASHMASAWLDWLP